jgi:hypothetical protein
VIASRGVGLTVVSAAVAVGIGFLIGYPAQVAAATAIAAAAVVSLVTTRELAARARLRAEPAARVTESPPLRQLRQVSETLAAAQASEFRADRDLRPLIRPIAAMRLARRGIDLDRHPTEARAMLGEPLWDLVQADRARASNLVAGGISAAGLESMIERLERI